MGLPQHARDGKTYYLEHLGNINLRYANRRNWKFDIYKKIGVADNLIATSEKEEDSDVKASIGQIIEDTKSNKSVNTPSRSIFLSSVLYLEKCVARQNKKGYVPRL